MSGSCAGTVRPVSRAPWRFRAQLSARRETAHPHGRTPSVRSDSNDPTRGLLKVVGNRRPGGYRDPRGMRNTTTDEQANRRYTRSTELPPRTKGQPLTPAPTPTEPPKRVAVYEYTFSRRRVAEPLGTVREPADVTAVLRDYLRPDEVEQERLVVALLNVKNAIIGVETVYIGNTSGSAVRVGEVFRSAVRLNASAIVVAHNHPSGDPTPSPEDVAITTALVAAGHLLDIPLLDHLIVGSYARSVSMRATGRIGS